MRPRSHVEPSSEQLYSMVMPLLVSFRISTLSLPHFRLPFLETNAANLQAKICRVLDCLGQNCVFASLIELLPGWSPRLR